MNGKEKEKFRRTSTWKAFKKLMDKLQPFDYVTKKKLTKRHQLHHLDLNPEHYTILDNNNFINLNPETHKIIHWIYSRYTRDPEIINRIKEVIDIMYKINEGKDVKDFDKN